MALPVEFNTVTLYGKYVELDGDPVVGYLTFKPSATIIKAMVSKAIVVPVVLEVELDANGEFSINLPATNDPDINPSDWTYLVTEGFGPRREYSISVSTTDAPSVNLFEKAPIPQANGTFYLQGTTGPAGPPAIITSGKPAANVGNGGSYAIDPTAGVMYYRATTTWDNGVVMAASAVAAHASLTTSHGVTGSIVGTSGAQTLSNKTLASPTITGTLTGAAATFSGAVTVGGNVSVTGDIATNNITGNLASFSKVTISGAVSATTDAATKAYVDALGTTVDTAGTVMRRAQDGSGTSVAQVFLINSPTVVNHAATKAYVDNADALKASLSGATFTGAVTVPTPTATGHAATKDYADTLGVSAPTASTVARRDAAGRLQVVSPSVAADVVTKSYADALGTTADTAATIMRRATDGSGVSVAQVFLTNVPTSGTHAATKNYADALGVSAPTVSTIARRDSAGRLQVVDPSASADVATKNYVDGKTSSMAVSKARQTTAQSGITVATWTLITYNTTDLDLPVAFAGGTYTCQAGQAGTYAVEGCIAVNGSGMATGSVVIARIRKNTTSAPGRLGPTTAVTGGAAYYIAGTGRQVITLAVGDTVDMQGYGTVAWATWTDTTDAQSWLLVERIR